VWLVGLAAGCGRFGFDERDVDAGVDGPPGVIAPAQLSIEWATPDRTMWQWDWSGDPAMLDHFELVTGPTEEAVRFRGAAATIHGPAQRPELGFPTLPGSNGTDRVVHTPIESLPGATVFARLVAFDRSGGESATEIVTFTSPPVPPHTILLFDDQFATGAYALPPELIASGSGLAFSQTCPGGVCFENLRVQGYAVDLTDIVTQNAFATAYLEMLVSTEITPSYWSQIRMCLQDCEGANRYKYDWITVAADAGYMRIEVPLRVLTNEPTGVALDMAELTKPLFEWGIGGSWANGSTTRVDEVRIRY